MCSHQLAQAEQTRVNDSTTAQLCMQCIYIYICIVHSCECVRSYLSAHKFYLVWIAHCK